MTALHRDQALVMVADDEEALRLLSRKSLEQAGFAVVEAENGAQAFSVFHNVRPDIVLLDVKMPVMDGFSACIKLRESPAARHTPILMMTALNDLDSIKRAYDVGATDFVNKPINWLILSHRVNLCAPCESSRGEAARKSSEACRCPAHCQTWLLGVERRDE